MFLSVNDLQVRPLDFDLKIAPGELDLLEKSLSQEGDLVARGVAVWNASTREIIVRGSVDVMLSYACERCLERVQRAVRKNFDLHYLPEDLGPVEEEREIHEADALIGFYSGGGLDLDDVLRELILLDMPMRRICEPACSEDREKGLEAALAHDGAERLDSRWDALKRLGKDNAPGTGKQSRGERQASG